MLGLIGAYFVGRAAGRNDVELEELRRTGPPEPYRPDQAPGQVNAIMAVLAPVVVFALFILAF